MSTHPAPHQLTALYQQAARATAAGSKSFYLASRFFPEELARAAHTIYWFCRHTDDLVDEAPDPSQASCDLDHWERLLRDALRTGSSSHPILHAFSHIVARYGIPHEYPLDLVAGVRMDLLHTRYHTFGHLRQFCYRVASVVGLMMSYVIGFRGDALRHAVDLGTAMQLTNILRDIGEDLRRGRIYLPLEDLHRFGYREDDLRAGVINDAFRRLMQFQIARARHYYKQAAPGIALLDARGRFAVRVAFELYQRILNQIEANGYQVFHRRAVVPRLEKYWITTRCLARPAARQMVGRLAFWRQSLLREG